MNISYGVPVLAPKLTGHPAALAADPVQPTADQKIAAMAEQADAAGAESSGQRQAPPSVMQLKIMEILERQAKEQETA